MFRQGESSNEENEWLLFSTVFTARALHLRDEYILI